VASVVTAVLNQVPRDVAARLGPVRCEWLRNPVTAQRRLVDHTLVRVAAVREDATDDGSSPKFPLLGRV
jgi:hypothetical protein